MQGNSFKFRLTASYVFNLSSQKHILKESTLYIVEENKYIIYIEPGIPSVASSNSVSVLRK